MFRPRRFFKNLDTLRYIEKAANSSDRDLVKNQLQLLHQQLLFERHRRETHAYGNRRLLADARNIRAFEEHNSALVGFRWLEIASFKSVHFIERSSPVATKGHR